VDEQRQFYFLEMNTRLQVEHPITEMVTGIDLVKQQIRIAAGEKLALRQEDIVMKGAAIECRIYAEDPWNNFFPSPGRIQLLKTPSGPGIRDDSGVYDGWTVPIDYDPLISKLVAWAETRHDAIDRMRRALNEYRVEGIQTNVNFFKEILMDRGFRAATFDTGFIAQWLQRRKSPEPPSQWERDFAAIAAALAESNRADAASDSRTQSRAGQWKSSGRVEGLRP
jgi:acetyl-CoA carboxylase biotin carboxylase subunit